MAICVMWQDPEVDILAKVGMQWCRTTSDIRNREDEPLKMANWHTYAVLAMAATAAAVSSAPCQADTVAVNIPAESTDSAWPVNLPFSLGYGFSVDFSITVTELGKFDIN